MHKCMRIELEGRTKKLRGKIKFSRGVVIEGKDRLENTLGARAVWPHLFSSHCPLMP